MILFMISMVIFWETPPYIASLEQNEDQRATSFTKEEKKRKVVLVIANKRSGSSFVGEMFMRNPSAYYLFEPLFPYTRECTLLQKERIDTLAKFSQCDFNDIGQEYGKVFNVTHMDDRYAQCMKHNVCFLDRNQLLKKAYMKTTNNTNTAKLDGRVLSNLCMSSNITVFKLIRTCNIGSLMDLLHRLPEIEFKIIHLVRDPRAIMSSNMQVYFIYG